MTCSSLYIAYSLSDDPLCPWPASLYDSPVLFRIQPVPSVMILVLVLDLLHSMTHLFYACTYSVPSVMIFSVPIALDLLNCMTHLFLPVHCMFPGDDRLCPHSARPASVYDSPVLCRTLLYKFLLCLSSQSCRSRRS